MSADTVLTRGFEPVESVLEGPGGYSFTPHARRQMADKKLSEFDIAETLMYPQQRTGPARNATYWNTQYAVIVNEQTFTITAVVHTDELTRPAHISAQRATGETEPEVKVIAEDDPRRVARELERLTAALNGGLTKKKTPPARVQLSLPMQPIQPPIPAPRLAADELEVALEPVHPALREQITLLADGDPARILVHSATRVEILPAG